MKQTTILRKAYKTLVKASTLADGIAKDSLIYGLSWKDRVV